jgi:cbb3-type cytochrome oxidase maturation protein
MLFVAMRIVYLLIPLTLLLAGFAIGAFIWAVRNGQFDDLEGPAHRILMDDDDPRIPRGPGHTRDAEPPSHP